jgi:hypothetical protein
MHSCWQILEIEPTSDSEVIGKARRRLIRKYHPDTSSDEGETARLTARCAEINAAHDQAVQLAAIRRRILHQPRGQDPHVSYTREPLGFSFSSQPVIAMAILLIVIFLFAFRRWIVALFPLAAMLAGAGVMACIDLVLYWMVFKRLPFSKSLGGLEWPPSVVAMSLLMGGNTIIVLLWLAGLADRIFSTVSAPLFSVGALLAVPGWLARRWLQRAVTDSKNS